jgi:uncharacterized protein (TIGR02145 family)
LSGIKKNKMKRYLLFLALSLTFTLQAQAPQGFNYQATVRNSSGDLIVNTNVYFKFNVMQGSQTSLPIFTETHYVPTDDLGQVNLVIGQGTANTGVFSELDWSQGNYYLGIELDTGSGYVAMGTTQLLSVPYALYAENSGNSTLTTPNLQSVLAENNSANNQQIKDLQDPTEAQDAVTLAYITQLETSLQDLQNQLQEQNQNIDNDFDGFSENNGDCDDTNAQVYSGAEEICDGLDNDCDGLVDEDAGSIFYQDSDGDGFGGSTTIQSCTQPSGYVAQSGDCDDSDANINPSAVEVCDGIDNNCDGVFDEGLTSTFYQDLDGDGFGSLITIQSCTQPSGYVAQGGDCDDSDATINPNSVEVCDGIDNNCDGIVDEGLTSTFYQDLDGDGFGSSITVQSCTQPSGYVAQNGDCDDSDATINPNASEICNGIDENCDSVIDDNCTLTIDISDKNLSICTDEGYFRIRIDGGEWNIDSNLDGDYYEQFQNDIFPEGTQFVWEVVSSTLPSQIDDNDILSSGIFIEIDDNFWITEDNILVLNVTPVFEGQVAESFTLTLNIIPYFFADIDSLEFTINSGDSFTHVLSADGFLNGNYNVNNGQGVETIDVGLFTYSWTSTDNINVTGETESEDQPEVSGTLINNSNEPVTIGYGINVNGGPQFCRSYTYYSLNVIVLPENSSNNDNDNDGYSENQGDCDDNNAQVNPGATEIEDGIDNDCDGDIDEGFDVDGDGYSVSQGDCDDNEANVYPGAPEIEDGIDNNCDGIIDEFIDPRDNNIYKTIVVNGNVWLAEDLRFNSENSHNPFYDDPVAGVYSDVRMYWPDDYDAIPEGWRIPTKEEWVALFNFVGGFKDNSSNAYFHAGGKLKSNNPEDWSSDCLDSNIPGTNEVNFNAVSYSFRTLGAYGSNTNSTDCNFDGRNQGVGWWSSTENSSFGPNRYWNYYIHLNNNYDGVTYSCSIDGDCDKILEYIGESKLGNSSDSEHSGRRMLRLIKNQ